MAVVNLGLVSPADATLEHECAEAHRGQDLAVVEDEAMIHRATAKLGRWLMFQFVRWTHHQRRPPRHHGNDGMHQSAWQGKKLI